MPQAVCRRRGGTQIIGQRAARPRHAVRLDEDRRAERSTTFSVLEPPIRETLAALHHELAAIERGWVAYHRNTVHFHLGNAHAWTTGPWVPAWPSARRVRWKLQLLKVGDWRAA
jgi:hypothetical protein